MKKASNNSLFEMACLHVELSNSIKRYLHVEEYLPKSLLTEIKNLGKKAEIEIQKRGL